MRHNFKKEKNSYLNKDNFLFIDYTNSLLNKDKNEFNINDLDFSQVENGYNKFTLTITDQVGNRGEDVVSYYLKDDDKIIFLGDSIDPELDYDNDGVKNLYDILFKFFCIQQIGLFGEIRESFANFHLIQVNFNPS